MCEHYVARAAEPFRLDELWPFTERLERYGIAGFGWGAAWISDERQDRRPTATCVPSGTTPRVRPWARSRRRRRWSTFGGRRSSRRSGSPDTQPFDDPAGRFSFSHNGDLRDVQVVAGALPGRRPDPRASRHGGRGALARGRVGWRGSRAARRLATLHETFGGQANLSLLTADGGVSAYAGNTENPLFTFRLGRIGLACTGIYSLDRSIFRFAAPGATERNLVRVG